jgi:hypothetical protein
MAIGKRVPQFLPKRNVTIKGNSNKLILSKRITAISVRALTLSKRVAASVIYIPRSQE